MRLHGKNAIVTGAGQGIGRAIAIRLAQEGANVVVNDLLSSKNVEQTHRAIELLGQQVKTIRGDMGQLADVQHLFSASVEYFGRVDILVNNVGIDRVGPFAELKVADFDRVLDVNLKSAFFLSQAFAHHLVQTQKPGKIIVISSVHEEIPLPGSPIYCASKGALKMLVRNLAVELGRHGITVNAIAPGAIDTPGNQELVEDKPRLAALLKQIPLGRLGTPEEVAGVAAFLASADADYVTGSTYFIDGGLTWFYEE